MKRTTTEGERFVKYADALAERDAARAALLQCERDALAESEKLYADAEAGWAQAVSLATALRYGNHAEQAKALAAYERARKERP